MVPEFWFALLLGVGLGLVDILVYAGGYVCFVVCLRVGCYGFLWFPDWLV